MNSLRILLPTSQTTAAYCAKRFIQYTAPVQTRYDPKVFRDPIVQLDKLKQPLDPDDERNFCYIKAMLSDQTPVFYRHEIINRIVNTCMKCGMKEKMRDLVYEALEIIKRRQYKRWKKASDEEKASIELDPVEITKKAIRNSSPIMMLRPYIRGGQTFMIPSPLKEHAAEFRAIKTMREICRKKCFHGATHFQYILADELLSAYRNEGLTVQAKQELHKQCEANRAYVHYRTR